jgi:hypothetical protein
MLCCAFTMGATSPVLLGYVKQRLGLGFGLSSLALVYLLSSAVIFSALRLFFDKDYHRETGPALAAA